MRVLVTGSSGHLGEALTLTLPAAGHEVVGLDVAPGEGTDVVGSITDADLVADLAGRVEAVVHTATLHKPHVDTHPRQAFVDVNISGTLTLLEAAAAAGLRSFVFTSTTSTFGSALRPPPGAPAAWITEAVAPVPRNIYGTTKTAAESLVELFARRHDLPGVILRTSRFFPEADDDPQRRSGFDDANLKLDELLYRRVDIEDVCSAHLAALDRAPTLGFGRYIVSATTPFRPGDATGLGVAVAPVLDRRVPGWADRYRQLGWSMLPTLDRVYDNAAARADLGWEPRHDFATVLDRVVAGGTVTSDLAASIGSKGYHGTDPDSTAGSAYPFIR